MAFPPYFPGTPAVPSVQSPLQLTLAVCADREAGCTPFATSLLADYFAPELRGTALGVYNWGIYFGYSMAYAVGNFITDANIMDMVSSGENSLGTCLKTMTRKRRE